MKTALGHVQHRPLDPAQGGFKHLRIRLVRTHLLGGDDVVEGNLQVLRRQFEEAVVDVGDDRQLKVVRQRLKRGHSVRKGWPMLDARAKARQFVRLRRKGQALAQLLQQPRQHVGVGSALGLQLGLQPAERLQHEFIDDVDVVAFEQRLQVADDAALPIDQRTVAVEGEGGVLAGVNRRHAGCGPKSSRRRTPRRAGRCGQSTNRGGGGSRRNWRCATESP